MYRVLTKFNGVLVDRRCLQKEKKIFFQIVFAEVKNVRRFAFHFEASLSMEIAR